MYLKGRNIILGITGSIAAYKSAFLTRLLIEKGSNVKIIVTPSALNFITPLTLSTLSKNPIYKDNFNADTGEWNNHVQLGIWADLMLIAPVTANTLSKMATGLADNLLLTTYLSAKCPVFFAPAMDLDMYQHPTTTENIKTLKNAGNVFIKPEKGELASGLEGEGRMAEPENIIHFLEKHNIKNLPLNGKKVLVTAGPTRESIDPVRYITNHSSGKMGYALAQEAINLGAEVILISGPTMLEQPKGCEFVAVETAEEMFNACVKYFTNADITIKAAAVADYTPTTKADKKIKKSSSNSSIELKRTKDILSYLGNKKQKGQLLIGFALETDHAARNAQKKLETKKLDFIVLNSLEDEGAGFGHDTNKVTIFNKDNKPKTFPLKSKKEIAKEIFNYIL